MQSIIHTMNQNNDFERFWKQIVYGTLDDDNDEQIMSYLRATQQQGTTFVKTIPIPQVPKIKLFVKCQEAVRKDVERTFDVLKSRFTIICGPLYA